MATLPPRTLPQSVLRYVERTPSRWSFTTRSRRPLRRRSGLRGAVRCCRCRSCTGQPERAVCCWRTVRRPPRSPPNAGRRADDHRQLAVSLANVQLYESLEQRCAGAHPRAGAGAGPVRDRGTHGRMAESPPTCCTTWATCSTRQRLADLVGAKLRDSRLKGLTRAVSLLDEHAHDLGNFVTQDPRGKSFPATCGRSAQR